MGYVRTGSRWRWPYRVIPFAINEDDFGTPPNSDHTAIKDAVAEWENNTVLTFRPRTDETSYIEFVQGDESTTCSSRVGMQTGRQKVFCDPSMNPGSLEHEIGHAVGLWHEHQRDDRDSFVTVWTDNVIDNKRYNFTKMGEHGIEVGAYDYGSIMHYGPRAFCVEWRYAVPVPRQFSFTRPALTDFNNTLHIVHGGAIPSLGGILPSRLWHSQWTASAGWDTDLIRGQLSGARPALAAFDNALHMVRVSSSPLLSSDLWHSQWTARNGWTTAKRIPGQGSRTTPALAAFNNALHMVFRDPRYTQLWHSRWTARSGWEPAKRISGQGSRTTPALAAFDNALHMVHRGQQSFDLWHSQWTASGGWTRAVRIPDQKSMFGPALGVLGPELHLAYSIIPKVWHSLFDGRSWGQKHRRDNNQTWTGPALAAFNGGLHSAHSGIPVRVPAPGPGSFKPGQILHTVRDTTLETITTVDPAQGAVIGQRNGLSPGDIEAVASMYRGF
ncbi:M12 family metallopeptidase [Streptomyces sp. NPDC052721]|uniref:M12 family metallopeptidase n=1 Tax=Streptomyces sp. NPDC052721 TaxID=3154955 RepID=UPI00343B3AED